jgi:hypothetical protein
MTLSIAANAGKRFARGHPAWVIRYPPEWVNPSSAACKAPGSIFSV